jgi:hypothetical protein
MGEQISMITTVTTTTMTVVSTAAAASLALIAILILLALLIQKQVVSGLAGTRARRLSKALNVAIMPLLIVFITSVVFKIVDALR